MKKTLFVFLLAIAVILPIMSFARAGDITYKMLSHVKYEIVTERGGIASTSIFWIDNWKYDIDGEAWGTLGKPISYGDVDKDGKKEAVLGFSNCGGSCSHGFAVVKNIKGIATFVTSGGVGVGSWSNADQPSLKKITISRQGVIKTTWKRNDTNDYIVKSFRYDKQLKKLIEI